VLRNLQQLSVANSCGYTLTPDRTFVAAAGSAVTVHMQTGTACEWSLQTNESWIHLPSGTSGAGPASVLLQVDANRGAARMGVVSVAGPSVRLTEARMHELAPRVLAAAAELSDACKSSDYFTAASRSTTRPAAPTLETRHAV